MSFARSLPMKNKTIGKNMRKELLKVKKIYKI